MVEPKDAKMADKLRFIEFSEALFREIPQSFGLNGFAMYNQKFHQYMQNIPVYGAILLNAQMTKVLLGT